MAHPTEAEINAGALAAISAAIDSNGENTSGVPDEEQPTGETAGDESSDDAAEGGESGEGEGTGDDGAEGDEAEGEEPATEADGTPRERNADGTFKSKEQKEADAAAKPTEGKGAEAAAAAAAKKAPDAINDPLPKDLKQETRARIETLIKTAKEITAERDTVKRDFDFMVQGVHATGTTPEQYGEVLSFMALFNSGDKTQQGKALDLLESTAERLALVLGRERSVGDPLANHADLKDAVAKGQITKDYAKQLAISRNGQTFRSTLEQNQNQRQTQEQHQVQALHTARTELTALENTLRTTDPMYEAKKAMIVPILQPIMAQLHPSQWKAAFEQAYAQAIAPKPVARSTTPVVPTRQPLRANKGGGGGVGNKATGPTSMLDAVNMALGGK